ncbi:uncharacterized protein LOC125070972 [Vanessa atalanta]|uniref:uncharacterized protein LOC125070972 n=1 Tax=Vanessa atalanta TaxID=42275 RepID=UPI001FCCCE65|nr:uncharacterized protein LOC125070972 [Vanessa atalanta]
MRVILFLLIIYTTIIYTSQFSDIKNNAISSIYKIGKRKSLFNDESNTNEHSKIKKDKIKVKNDRLKSIYNRQNLDSDKQHYLRNSVRNYVKKRSQYDGRRAKDTDTSDTASSSIEIKNWKDEWKEHWLHKKLEAINSSIPKGDTVNIVAARPWGVPCGDPNQHDAPWGSCMLPMECEAEYRIYRGDYFCGRTKFICCALQITTYDMYAGFDVSFADSSLATDSEEKKNRERGSKERKRRKRIRDRKRRLRDRNKRKRKIKRTIRKIIREIRKVLNRSFRNGTTARKRKTKQLKKFIKEMKKRYIKDRKAVQDIHEIELTKIDAGLLNRLNEIKGMNQQYVKNATFRNIVVNGTISRQNQKILVEAYPDLMNMLNTRRRESVKPKDYLDYDIEYGYLYY